MQPPKVKLMAADGRSIPDYFLPFEPRPQVDAQSSQDVQLRYWLDAEDMKGALALEVDGKTIPIKGANAFDLNSIKNDEEKVIQPGAW